MKISIIVAMSENRVIGKNNQLPWHLPNDLKRFKTITLGKPVIMGPKTFESIGKILPGRQNIVLTHDPKWQAPHPDVWVVHSRDSALASAKSANLGDEVMIMGGAGIYETFLPIADTIYLTKVEGDIEGDTYFPEMKGSDWKTTMQEKHLRDSTHSVDYTFMILERV